MSNKLYHYTSVANFLNIINNKCFWASDIQFMNDSKELELGIDVLKNYLGHADFKERIKTKLIHSLNSHKIEHKQIDDSFINLRINDTSLMLKRNLLEFFNEYSINNKANIDVISFTSKEDDISQWMSYCPENQGISIEFNKESLNELCLTDSDYNNSKIVGLLTDVIYVNDCTESITRKFDDLIVDVLLSQIQSRIKHDKFDDFSESCASLLKKVSLIITSLKNSSFEHEKEKRVIFLPHIEKSKPNGATVRLKIVNYVNDHFREKNGVIIPYEVINFDPKQISKVIIGPSPNQSMCKKGLEFLKRSKKLDFEIVESQKTLRNF